MAFIQLLLLTAVAVLLQPIAASELSNPALRPDVLLLPLIVAVLRWPGPLAVVWGGLIGLMVDCLAGQSLGPQMATFALFSAIGTVTVPQRRLSAIEIALFAFGLTFVSETLSSAICILLDGRTLRLSEAAAGAAKSAMMTTLVIGMLWLMGRVLGRRMWLGRDSRGRRTPAGWQASTE
jgi:rod shape-determining protein MreD